ncbi:MAG: hypothetical protein MK198_06815 [Gracilimonas sp.]|uniref:hypothetical protein n=1 Tax=Gracilimonas sp. TaxID=1974203 RepID=UPI003750D6B4|nr:hypothetical protein [Gracilimonas sp.]
MKNRFRKISVTITTSIVLVFTACTPSNEDIKSYLSEENYERVYEYVHKQLENHSTQNNPAFDSGLSGLIFSNTSYSSEAINLFTSSEFQVPDKGHLATNLWGKAIEKKTDIPEGLHSFIYKNHQAYGSSIEPKIQKYYQADSLFQPLLIEEIRSISLWDKPDYMKLDWLISLTDLSNPHDYVKEIIALKSKESNINKVFSDSLEDNQLWINDYSSRIDSLNAIFPSIEKRYEEQYPKYDDLNSAVFLVSSFIGDFQDGEINYEAYEATIYSTTGGEDQVFFTEYETFILLTTEKSFSGRGRYRLSYYLKDEIPVRLKEDYGGFKTTMKVVKHVGEREFDDLLHSSTQVSSINSKIELYSRLLNHFQSEKEQIELERTARIKELNAEIVLLDKRLKDWAKDN